MEWIKMAPSTVLHCSPSDPLLSKHACSLRERGILMKDGSLRFSGWNTLVTDLKIGKGKILLKYNRSTEIMT